MFCIYCGREVDDNTVFCPHCGQPVTGQAPAPAQPVYASSPAPAPAQPAPMSFSGYLLSQNGGLFLALCILLTVSAATGIFAGSVPLLTVLFSIFLWTIYSRARTGVLDVKNMRCVSGTAFAQYVVGWIAAGALAFCGVIMLILLITMNTAFVADILSELPFDISQSLPFGVEVASSIFLMILAIGCLFAAVVVVIFNLLGYRAIHRFCQSLYRSAETGVPQLLYVDRAKNWLLVFGIVSALTAVSSGDGLAFVSNGTMAAAEIIGYLLIKKIFVEGGRSI